ncbi:hypothetical protein D3C84_912680 [compost metagenome]
MQADAFALFGNAQQARVELCPLRRAQLSGQSCGTGEPQGVEQFQRIAETRVDLFDVGTQLRQALHCLGHHPGHLRIDLHVAEIRAVGDTQASEISALS